MSLLLLNVTLRGVSNKHCLLSLFSFALNLLDKKKIVIAISVNYGNCELLTINRIVLLI